MEKIARFFLIAICYGFIGVVFGAVTGCVIGAVSGLIFGGVKDGIAEAVFLGVFLCGITFAWTAVIWDDGESLLHIFRVRNPMSKPAILFLCTNNAVRSQMAEALLKKKAADQFDAYSAGTEPKESIHPLTVQVMSEVGIDLSGQRPKGVHEYLGRLPVRVAVFVCPRAEEKCPTIWPGALSRLDWPLEDPAGVAGAAEEVLARFRSVRDQIDGKLSTWLAEVAVEKQ